MGCFTPHPEEKQEALARFAALSAMSQSESYELEENGPAGGISGRLVRSPEYVFDLGTTVARAAGRYSPSGGLLYQRLCWSGQTPGNGCCTTSSGSIPTIFVAGKHPGTAECRQARCLHRQKPNGSGRKTYHSILRSGWQPRYRSSQTMTNS